MAQVILVTGSSTGFGRLMVETFARQGHIVFAGIRATTGKNASITAELKGWAAQQKFNLQVVELDVTDDSSVANAVQTIMDAAGRIDVVVNNAGVLYFGPLEAYTPEQAQTQFDVNVFGALRVNRTVLPFMRHQSSGLIVQIGSIVGRFAVPFTGLYSASKFALEGLYEAYRYELAPLGIDATIVEPGTFPTNIAGNGIAAADQPRYVPYQGSLAIQGASFQEMASVGEPQQVADAVADLIAQPSGSRPMRVVVARPDQASPTVQFNQAFDKSVQQMAEALKLTELYRVN